jgi:DNA polymerase I
MLLIDASNLAYIAHFTMGDLSHYGNDTGIIYGVMRAILELGEKLESNDMVFCFEEIGSIRKTLYPKYKEGRRSKMNDAERESIHKQIIALKDEILPSLGFSNCIAVPGLEADDIMAKIALQNVGKTIIVSSDGDMLQCLAKNVFVYNTSKQQKINKAVFSQKYGIESERWHEVKGIAGCVSDNVSGCMGIGEKTAIKYLNNELKMGTKAYDKINSYVGTDQHKLTLSLVTLPFKDTPEIEINPVNKFSKKGFMDVCERYNFQSFKEILGRWRKFFRGDLSF